MIEKLLFPFLSKFGLQKMFRPLAVLTLMVSSIASAQDTSRALRGAWEITTPDGDTFVLILKGQGLASYFWGENADRTVYQGNWEVQEDRAQASWPDGSTATLEKTTTGFTVDIVSGSDGSSFTTDARKIPPNILGQWAKPPERDTAGNDEEEAEGFFGTWMVGEDASKYVFVHADRSAASTLGNNPRGQRGQWARHGRELHIIWDSGEYSIISEIQRGYTYKLIESGVVIEEDETETQPAIRTTDSEVPAEWMRNYKSERAVATGGIAFTSRKAARAFFRGDWVVKRGDTEFERIEIKRFGGLATSTDRTLGGQWRQAGQDIFMQWDDGMRKILSPVGQGFVLYEFQPGRPLDGVPTRVLATAPADDSKFEKYVAGRSAVAEEMKAMAAAAGISEDDREKSGFGRTFARWVWPFDGEKDGAKSTEDIIDEEYAPTKSEDPWWWPFWSEKKQKPEAVEAETNEVTPAEELSQETRTNEEAQEKSSGWKWPF